MAVPEDEESPFKKLFADLGVEGSGAPPPAPEAPPPSEVRAVVLGFERRKGNKSVTTVRDLPAERLEEMLREVKKGLGTGGAVVDGSLVIQGDRRAALTQWFEARGVRVRGERQ